MKNKREYTSGVAISEPTVLQLLIIAAMHYRELILVLNPKRSKAMNLFQGLIPRIVFVAPRDYLLRQCEEKKETHYFLISARASIESLTISRNLSLPSWAQAALTPHSRKVLRLHYARKVSSELERLLQELCCLDLYKGPKIDRLYRPSPRFLTTDTVANYTGPVAVKPLYLELSTIILLVIRSVAPLYLYFRAVIELLFYSLRQLLKLDSISTASEFSMPILSFQEDDISSDPTIRVDQYWYRGVTDLNLFTIRNVRYGVDRTHRASNGKRTGTRHVIKSLEYFDTLRFGVPCCWKIPYVSILLKETVRSLLFRKSPPITALINWLCLILILRANLLVGVIRKYGISKCIYSEPWSSGAEAAEVAKQIQPLVTYSYQYSNLHHVHPIMISLANTHFMFSKLFLPLCRWKEFGPSATCEAGYPYSESVAYVRERALNQREKLRAKGVRIILGYFDESTATNGWGLVDKTVHLERLKRLAAYVRSDPRVAVVVKSQFVRNVPSNLYSTCEELIDAKRTGRWLELSMGTWRNKILPTEIGVLADVCIGEKYGATAALEAALAGCARVYLIDHYNFKSPFDNLYEAEKIVFKSLDECLREVTRLINEPLSSLTPSWARILEILCPTQDISWSDKIKLRLQDVD